MWLTDSENMDTYVGKLGCKIFFSVAIFMILVQNSSSTAVEVSGDENLETLVELIYFILAISSSIKSI